MKNIDIKTTDFFDNFDKLNENSVVLDFGANIGDVTSTIYNKYKCYIHSYEPNIACYNFMRKRFSDKPKIKLYNNAVSDFNGEGFLYFHHNSKGNDDKRYIQGASLRKDKDNIDINKKIKVKIICISNILNLFKNIDFIKIDIEGSEYNILPELIKNRKKIRTVLCEMHGNPDGKKINGQHKNKNFTLQYDKTIDYLKAQGLYNNWFFEWH